MPQKQEDRAVTAQGISEPFCRAGSVAKQVSSPMHWCDHCLVNRPGGSMLLAWWLWDPSLLQAGSIHFYPLQMGVCSCKSSVGLLAGESAQNISLAAFLHRFVCFQMPAASSAAGSEVFSLINILTFLLVFTQCCWINCIKWSCVDGECKSTFLSALWSFHNNSHYLGLLLN